MKRSILPLLLLLATTAAEARSSSGRSGGSSDDEHLLSVAGGVSAPSLISSVFENPAGLTANGNSRVLIEGLSDSNSLSPIGGGVGFFTGNGSVGAGLDVRALPGSNLMVSIGLAAEIPSIGMALGVSTSETNGSGWGANAGVLFNPHGKTRIGITAFGLFSSINALGTGIAVDPTAWATLAVDGAYDLTNKSTIVKPGMTIRLPVIQLTTSYGVRVQGTGGGWIREGFTLGIGIPLGKTFALQGYYNELAKYYAGLTISL